MSASGFRSRSLSRKRAQQAFPSFSPVSRQRSSLGIGSKFVQLGAILWSKRPRSRSEFRRFCIRVFGVGTTFGVLFLVFLYLTLPDIGDPASLLASQSTVITDRNGVELYRLFQEEDRTYVPAESIPAHAKESVIAIEDERFYERGCLDVRAIARAVFRLGRQGGGSTITRQLARNALDLRKQNRYIRKVKELILGCQLESQYSKDELLELYLNWIPFGRNAYGIEQASKVYFGKTASGLTIAQSSILASLPQRPSYFSPYGRHIHTTVTEEIYEQIVNGDISKVSQIDDDTITIGLLGGYVGTGSSILYIGGRTDQVLRNMQDQGFITEAERLSALDELETIIFSPLRESIRAAHFVLSVREQVLEIFEGTAEVGLLEQGGLTIETSLDWELQEAAEAVIAFHREDIQLRYGAENMALVAIDPDTNEVLSYVGNMDYNDEENGGKIDMVLAPRQPGSSFKPFVYASAFQNGYNPATPLYDVPTKIGDDEPQNFDGKHTGLITIRQALGASRNIPAAKAFFLAGGEDQILGLVSALGASTPLSRKAELQQERADGFDYGWPLALGAAETPLLEMVNAYGAIARGGKAKPIITIRQITDKKGNLLYQSPKDEEDDVLDERIAYQITSILSDESARPEEYWRTQLTIPGYETAAKTGTSNKCLEWGKDEDERICKLRKPDNAWLVGYTPELLAGVWVGNADSASMYDKGGGLNTASPIWRDYMMRAHRKIQNPKTTFDIPEGIVQPQISRLSGQLPTECTPVQFRRADVFLEEAPPRTLDPACKSLVIDKVSRLLASDDCPTDALASGSFLVAGSLLPDRWPDWEEGVQEWVTEQMELWYAAPDHSGAIIPLPVAPTEKCSLIDTPGREVQPTLSVVLPTENGTATYPSFRPKIKYEVGSTVREVRYEIDGRGVATVLAEPYTETLRAPRSVKKEGRHRLTVTLTDEYFNTVSHVVHFRFEEDTIDPQVRFTLPRGDITLPEGGTLRLKADAEDQEGGVKYVQFYINSTLLSTKPKEPYSLDYDIDVDPGSYTVKVKATDLAGNTSEDTVKLTVK